MPIRVVVVGDDSMSLCTQVSALARAMNFDVVGMLDEAASARALMREARPDVAVVAMGLREGNGFDLIASLSARECPAAVVLCSPRDEDAVRAFELNATDFVTLPVRPERLADALTRARRQALRVAMQRTADELQRMLAAAPGGLEQPARASRSGVAISLDTEHPATSVLVGAGAWAAARAPGSHADGDPEAWRQSVRALVRERQATVSDEPGTGRADGPERSADAAEVGVVGLTMDEAFGDETLSAAAPDGIAEASFDGMTEREERPSRVLVREGRRTRFVSLQDVDWFEADGNYVLVRTAGESYRTRGTMSAIERVLDPTQFVRIHRRVVVNMDRVRELAPLPGGDGMLTLGDGSTLRLSRTYRSRVR